MAVIAPLAKEILLKENQTLNQYVRILYQILKFICINCEETSLKDSFSPKNIILAPTSKKDAFLFKHCSGFLN